MRAAIFLDKDGTLIEDVPYNCDVTRMHLMAGAAEGLSRFFGAGYRIVVISNQSGIAHGFFSEQALKDTERHLRRLLRTVGVPLDGFYYCPHHPEGRIERYAIACPCRKPRPGLLLRAAADHRIDIERSWMVGDILDDVEAGHRAGCKTLFIHNGHETEWDFSSARRPEVCCYDLAQAASVILAKDSRKMRKQAEFGAGPC